MNSAKTTDLFSELSPPFSDEHDLQLLAQGFELDEWEDDSTSFFQRPIPLTEQRERTARGVEEVSRVVDVEKSHLVAGSAAQVLQHQPEAQRGAMTSLGLTAVVAGLVLAAATLLALFLLRASAGPVTHAIKDSANVDAAPAAVQAPSESMVSPAPAPPSIEERSASSATVSPRERTTAARRTRTAQAPVLPTPTRFVNGAFRSAN